MLALIHAQDPLHQLGDGVLALGLVMARWMGLALIMPVFSRTGLTGVMRGGFAFAMAVPMLPLGLGAVATLDPEQAVTSIVLLTFKEGGVGIALGVLLGFPFWAAEMAGELLEVQRGRLSSSLADPEGMNEATVLGTFFVIATICLFLIAGGVDVIASAVYDSYRLWPLSSIAPQLSAASSEVFVDLMQKLMIIAVSLGAPLVIATLVSDVLLGFVARLAPSLNSYQMGAAIKSLILALLMPIYAQFFIGNLVGVFGQLRLVIPELEGFLK